jgi:sulfite exporter TauE/SafE
VLLGVGGIPHCAAMCGPLTLWVAGKSATKQRSWQRALCHAGGRALAYALLGFGAALAWQHCVERASITATGWRITQSASAALAAVVLLYGAAQRLGLTARRTPPASASGRAARWSSAWRQTGARLVASLQALGPRQGAFALGVFNAFLPCGLSWGAVLLASQAAPLHALGASGVFGALTAVGPLALFASSRWISARAGGLARAGMAALLIVGAGVCLWRGVGAWSAAAPACCAADSDSAPLASEVELTLPPRPPAE